MTDVYMCVLTCPHDNPFPLPLITQAGLSTCPPSTRTAPTAPLPSSPGPTWTCAGAAFIVASPSASSAGAFFGLLGVRGRGVMWKPTAAPPMRRSKASNHLLLTTYTHTLIYYVHHTHKTAQFDRDNKNTYICSYYYEIRGGGVYIRAGGTAVITGCLFTVNPALITGERELS